MSNETLSTKIALLEQNSKSNETTHLQMAMDIKELKQDNKDIKISIQGIELSIAELPKTLSDEFDKRYASKSVEEEVEKIKEKAEDRTYEWLKWFIVSIVGIGFGVVSYIITSIIK